MKEIDKDNNKKETKMEKLKKELTELINEEQKKKKEELEELERRAQEERSREYYNYERLTWMNLHLSHVEKLEDYETVFNKELETLCKHAKIISIKYKLDTVKCEHCVLQKLRGHCTNLSSYKYIAYKKSRQEEITEKDWKDLLDELEAIEREYEEKVRSVQKSYYNYEAFRRFVEKLEAMEGNDYKEIKAKTREEVEIVCDYAVMLLSLIHI